MRSRLLESLSIRSFFFLWLAGIFQQIAVNLMNFVLIFVAFELTNSNTAVSGIILSTTIPAIFLGIFAGAYVDRRSKKTILFYTNIIRAILLLVLIPYHNNLMVLYTVAFSVSLVSQFFVPAESPLIPRLVKKELLLSANALFGIGVFGSILFAYALSGPVLIFLGKKEVFLLLCLLYALAAFLISFVHIRSANNKQEEERTSDSMFSIRYELMNAFSLISRTKKVYRAIFLLTFSQVLILVIGVIGPGYARTVLDIPINQFPILFVTPATLGMVVGALALSNFFNNANREKSATIGVLMSGFSTLLLPYGSKIASREIVKTFNQFLPSIADINILHIMIFLAFILGIANALVFVPSNTILQEETSDAYRGKVYGVLNSFIGLFSLVPIILVGSLSDIFGVGRVITGIAIVILFIGFSRFIIK